MKIAFDIGGVLSKYTQVCKEWLAVMKTGGAEVFILTDMHDRAQMLYMLALNGIDVPADHVYTADYKKYGEACKAILMRQLGIDILVDDHPGYTIWPWPEPAPMRLLVQPDVRRAYYAPEWATDGKEGDFGRKAFYEEEQK